MGQRKQAARGMFWLAIMYMASFSGELMAELLIRDDSPRSTQGAAGPLPLIPTEAFCSRAPPLVCARGGIPSNDTVASSANLANLRPSLRRALADGFKCVTIDVTWSQDGQLVAVRPTDFQVIQTIPIHQYMYI
jgi:hypothetical protein